MEQRCASCGKKTVTIGHRTVMCYECLKAHREQRERERKALINAKKYEKDFSVSVTKKWSTKD